MPVARAELSFTTYNTQKTNVVPVNGPRCHLVVELGVAHSLYSR